MADIVYDQRGYPYKLAAPRNSLLSEGYRTGVGAAADTVDALTGLGAEGVNLLLRRQALQGTNLGERIPQPWAAGNRIMRSAIPAVSPGMIGANVVRTAPGVARVAAPVLKSAVAREAPAMAKESSDITRRGVLGIQDVLQKYSTPVAAQAEQLGRQDIEDAVSAGFKGVKTKLDRRQVAQGLAATAVAAPLAGKIASELLPVIKTAAPKVANVAKVRSVSTGVFDRLVDKAVEYGAMEPGAESPINPHVVSAIRAHKRAASGLPVNDPRRKLHDNAMKAWMKVEKLNERAQEMEWSDHPSWYGRWDKLVEAHDEAFSKAAALTERTSGRKPIPTHDPEGFVKSYKNGSLPLDVAADMHYSNIYSGSKVSDEVRLERLNRIKYWMENWKPEPPRRVSSDAPNIQDLGAATILNEIIP